MMSKIKPIQTTYKGYRFRSRLEARWAVFFDFLDIKWEYEKQGYVLPPYKFDRPDFLNRRIAEARREGLGEHESFIVQVFGKLADELEVQAQKELTYLPDFWLPGYESWAEVKPDSLNPAELIFESEKIMRFVHFIEQPCIWCSEFSREIPAMKPSSAPQIVEITSLVWGGTDEMLEKAITKARSARFEHGESPNILD
jgi:hypothetical protein